jgi:hypothetical protein
MKAFISTLLLTSCLLVAARPTHAQEPSQAPGGSIASADQPDDPASREALPRGWPGRRVRLGFLPPMGDTTATRTAERGDAAPAAVHGTGTVGTVPLWFATGPSGNPMLGDSIVIQSDNKIGIGVAAPASKLTVNGTIETTLGGYKFADGTIQTTAAISGLQAVVHDSTLQGDGTTSAPLGVADFLELTNLSVIGPSSAQGAAARIENTGVGGGSGIGLTVRGAPDHVGATGGEGMRVFGGFSEGGLGGAGILVGGGGGINNGAGGQAVRALGGQGISGGGDGISTVGGAVIGTNIGQGGHGLTTAGGAGTNGGDGVNAVGGDSRGAIGGFGVRTRGGDNVQFGFGGHGVFSQGGSGIGGGRSGGLGIFAQGGLGQDGASHGDAGHFIGNVEVSGNLSKGGGSFKIDHPLDPENKYLYHSFIESPDMKNIYDGTLVTDADGNGVVTLPDYFEALNRDFRYQLTVIGTFAQAVVAEEIKNNCFRVRTDRANVKVSWQVTGIRHDAYAEHHRITVEENKPAGERGFYLYPEVFNQPEERRVEWARNPELLGRQKENGDRAQTQPQPGSRRTP